QIDGEWASAVLHIAPYANYRVALTGTPVPKSYTDFFNLFDFLYLGAAISSTQKILLRNYETNNDKESATNLLMNTIGPFFYRVRKPELGLADQVLCDPVEVKMNHSEETIYNAIITRIINYSRDDYYKNIDYVNNLIRGRMIRLRQCISYTKLLSKTIDDYDEDLL